jgi:hypothetical protein
MASETADEKDTFPQESSHTTIPRNPAQDTGALVRPWIGMVACWDNCSQRSASGGGSETARANSAPYSRWSTMIGL